MVLVWFYRWWQLKYFWFSPLPGEMIQFDEHIFQMGWSHQLVLFCPKTQQILWIGRWCQVMQMGSTGVIIAWGNDITITALFGFASRLNTELNLGQPFSRCVNVYLVFGSNLWVSSVNSHSAIDLSCHIEDFEGEPWSWMLNEEILQWWYNAWFIPVFRGLYTPRSTR